MWKQQHLTDDLQVNVELFHALSVDIQHLGTNNCNRCAPCIKGSSSDVCAPCSVEGGSAGIGVNVERFPSCGNWAGATWLICT